MGLPVTLRQPDCDQQWAHSGGKQWLCSVQLPGLQSQRGAKRDAITGCRIHPSLFAAYTAQTLCARAALRFAGTTIPPGETGPLPRCAGYIP